MRWAQKDLNAAVSWVDSLSGKDQTNAARAVIGKYAQEDAAQASVWLSSMSNEPGYENLVSSYIEKTAEKHPVLALSHVKDIKNAEYQKGF